MAAKSNAKWIGLAQAVKILSQLIGMSVLARLLDKSDFGLMAIAWSVINFANLFRDLGVSSAVIQINELSEETKTASYFAALFLGAILFIFLCMVAPFASTFMGADGLTTVVVVLAFSFPISSFGTTHLALLERHSQYKKIAIIESGASLLALGAAVIFVYSGLGVLSLALQTIVAASISSYAFRKASGWRSSSKLSLSSLKEVGLFGSKITLFNFLNYLARNGDALIIGRTLGASVLGGYSMAYKLMLFPLQSLSFVSNRALYPIMSRSQTDSEIIADLYFKSLRLVVAISAPLMVGLFVMRVEIVSILFGEQWLDVAELLCWLAPVGILQSITSTTGVVFMAKGATKILVRLGALGACLQILSILIGVNWGILGVVMAYLIANVINTIPCLVKTANELKVGCSRFFEVLAAPIVSAALMGVGVLILKELVSVSLGSAVVVLSVGCILGAFFYTFLLFLFQRELIADISGFFVNRK